jgi:hypothetical protein
VEGHRDEVENPGDDCSGQLQAVRTVYGFCTFKNADFERQTNDTPASEIDVFKNVHLPYIRNPISNQKGIMKNPLTKALCTILEFSIDKNIVLKNTLQSEVESRLKDVEHESHVSPLVLVALIRGLLEVMKAQDQLGADRFSLLKYSM